MLGAVRGLVPGICHSILPGSVAVYSAGAGAATLRVSRSFRLLSAGVILAMSSAPFPIASAEQVEQNKPSTAPKAGTASAGPQPFSPGVRINWGKRHVEVDAEVVLRKGPLELLACSPRTREHESILVVHSRPRDIYQAMGLIGLEPGSPIRFDEANDRTLPPTGDLLELLIRYEDRGVVRRVPARVWLRDAKSGRPPRNLEWVFSGSRTFEGGRFGADSDGTVACVVDFDTALIAVGATHTADNESLWLSANTEAIPPIGTQCVLEISGLDYRPVIVEVDKDGTFRRGGSVLTPAELKRELDQAKKRNPVPTRVVLLLPFRLSERLRKAVVESLVKAGVDRKEIAVKEQEPGDRNPHSAGESNGG